MQSKKHLGSCLCGATRYSFVGDLDDGYFCHCSQCRKNYGLYGALVGVVRSTFVMTKSAKLRSFKSSNPPLGRFAVPAVRGLRGTEKATIGFTS